MHPQEIHTPPADTATNTSLSAELPFGQPPGTERIPELTHLPDPPEGTSSTRSFVTGSGERVYVGQTSVRRDVPKNKIPKFKGSKVSRFLDRYEIEFLARGCTEQDMAFYLPTSVKLDWLQLVRGLPGYATRDWNALKKSMKDTFGDEEKYKYSLNHLRRFVTAQKRKGRPNKLSRVNRVYLKFAEITSYLKGKHIISEQEESRSFLSMLPEDIVEMFYSRRDMRQLAKNAEDVDDDEEDGALPEIRDILKELQAIFASFAKRGKISKIRGKRQWDSSDSESDEDEESEESDVQDSSEESESEEEKTHRAKNSHSKASRSHSRSHSNSTSQKSSKAHKSSKSSDSDRGIERMRMPKMRDEVVDKLLSKFDELQVTVAQMGTQVTTATAAATAAVAGQTYARRPSFGTPNNGRPQYSAPPQNPNVSRWNTPRRDAPPHESNAATYESNFAGSGSNAIPVGGAPPNQWGSRAPVSSPSAPYIPPHQRTANPQYAATSPSCLWCGGEDGPPHWMYSCKSLDEALKGGLVQRNASGKLQYGMRYIPGRAHPRGMRAWVAEQEEIAKASAREKNVSFAEVSTNSIEYEPPEISEGQGEYEATHVQVDEYEVNAGKRTRSASDENAPPKKNVRTHKPRESLFEDLGGPRSGITSDKENDVEMKEPARRRSPTVPKPKLESAVESKADTRTVLEKLLQQEITIPMSVMLASSPELAKAMVNECRRKRMPAGDQEVNHVSWTGEEFGDEPQVNLNSYEGSRKSHRSKSYYAGVLAFANVNIEGETIKALLDNGSMICMMQDRVRKRLGLPIRTDGTHKVRMAGGSLEVMLGISEDVPVRIGGVTTYVHFFISEGSSNGVLLGQNFLRQVEARFSYHADGSVMMGMTYRGRRITVEVTGKDESRYLAKVPGESGEYDSSMVQYLEVPKVKPRKTYGRVSNVRTPMRSDEDGEDQDVSAPRVNATAQITRGRFMEGTEVSSTGLKVPIYSTRSHSPMPVPETPAPSPAPRYRENDSTDEDYVEEPEEWKGKGREKLPAETKEHESEQRPRRKSGPRKNRHWRQGRKDHPPSDEDAQSEPMPTRPPEEDGPVASTSGTAGNRQLDESPPTPAIDALLAHAQALQQGENAVMSEVSRREALQELSETRTGPWIATCTPEEAAERAQDMRDEYDRFLTVLFGRKIPLMRDDARKKEPKDLQQTLAPERTATFKTPRTRECSSMMFTVHTSRPLSPSLTNMNVFDDSPEPGSPQEGEEFSVDTDIAIEPAAACDLESTYEDWIDGQHRQIYEYEETRDQQTQTRRTCAQEGDILVENSVFSPPTTSKQSEGELVRELGLQMASAELTSNYVDLLVEGSSAGESDFEEDSESVSNEFGISEDITFEMLSQAGWRDDDSDDDMGLTDEMNPVNNYTEEGEERTPELTTDPLFIGGAWRTFELASTDDEGGTNPDNEFLDKLLGGYVDQRISQELEHAARQRLNRTADSRRSGKPGEEDVLFTVNSVNLLETDGRAKIQFKGEEASLVVAREIWMAETDLDKLELLKGRTDEEKDQLVLAELRAELKRAFHEVTSTRLDKQVAEMTARAREGMETENEAREMSASRPLTPECSQTSPESSPDDSPPKSEAPKRKQRGRPLKREGAEIWTEGFGHAESAAKTPVQGAALEEDLKRKQEGQMKPREGASSEKSTTPFLKEKKGDDHQATTRISSTQPALEIDNGIRFRVGGEVLMPTAEALEARMIIAEERALTNGWDGMSVDEKTACLARKRCELACEGLPAKQEHEANLCRIPDLSAARSLLPEEEGPSAHPIEGTRRPAFDRQVMEGIAELERSRELLREIREFVEKTCLDTNALSLEGTERKESVGLEDQHEPVRVQTAALVMPTELPDSYEEAMFSESEKVEVLLSDPWDDWELDEKIALLAEERRELGAKRRELASRIKAREDEREQRLLEIHDRTLHLQKRAEVRDQMKMEMFAAGFSPEYYHQARVGIEGYDEPTELQHDQLMLRELREFLETTCLGMNSVQLESSTSDEWGGIERTANTPEELSYLSRTEKKQAAEEGEARGPEVSTAETLEQGQRVAATEKTELNLQKEQLGERNSSEKMPRTILDAALSPNGANVPATNGLLGRGWETSPPPLGILFRPGGITIVSEEDENEAETEENEGSDTSKEDTANEGKRTPTNELVQRLERRKSAWKREKAIRRQVNKELLFRKEEGKEASAFFGEDLKCLWCSRDSHGEDHRRKSELLRHESFERTAQLENKEVEEAEMRAHFRVNSVQLESTTSSGKAQPLAKA
ncbi:hypothetical protein P7C70_g5111, partial [Phenoliferia sp. Uapishka_3]